MGKVLLVDDDAGVLFTLKEVLLDHGHEPLPFTSAGQALREFAGVDAAVVDLAMPEMDGLELLRALRERDPALPIIILTAHGSERMAVKAMKAGAYDYLTKPFDIDEMVLAVERAIELRHLRAANRRLAAEQALGKRIIGEGPAMAKLLESVARVADKDVTVLIRGETGTGKELVAALLHAQSRRRGGPFVRFNCAALPGELAEAELFGHAKGAFTGAHATRQGFFAQAHGGTLVLDEVGELPLAVQAKLLRALQEGEIQPVGAGRIERVDVRIIACTHRDLAQQVRAGTFREDLYYRLAVIDLLVPSLRERREDIPALAREFARRYGEKFGVQGGELAPALIERLTGEPWPGNVRQLENTVARLVALSPGGPIGPEAFVPAAPAAPSTQVAPDVEHAPAHGGPSLREQVESFERNLIARALAAAGGNQSEAARLLGTSRVTLVDKIRKHGLAPSRRGEG